MAVQINCGDVLWNLADQFWNDPDGVLFWFCPAQKQKGRSYSDAWDAYYNANPDERNLNNTQTVAESDFIKVYLTIHNEFLTENQSSWLKAAGAFPSYEEKKQIEEGIKVAVDLTGDDSILSPFSEIEVQNIKLGFKQIIEHVSNNSKK